MTILECWETRLLHVCWASQLKWPIHPHHAGPHSDAEPLLYADPAMKVSTFDVISNKFLDWPVLSIKNFIPWLKDHLLGCLYDQPYDGDQEPYSDQDWMSVHIVDNQVYSSQLLRVNYTTYNIRRDQDSVNPHTHSDVMVSSHEDDPQAHPYWYAQVLGVFHLRVLHLNPSAMNRLVQHMEVLWVWWFGLVPGHWFGSKVAQLPKIGFVPDTDLLAFGFLDPSLVVHATHLIPAFNDGWTAELLATSPTAGRLPGETDDWVAFFVSM